MVVWNLRCVVVDCINTNKNSDCKFYTFPTAWFKQEQRNKWINAIRRKNPDGSLWQPKTDDRICSAHFIGGRKADEQASPSYVPRIFPASYKSRQINENAAISRFQRYMERRKKEIEAVNADNTISDVKEVNIIEEEEECEERNLCMTKDQFNTNSEVIDKLVLQEESVVKKKLCKENDSCVTIDIPRFYANHEMKVELVTQEELLVKEEPREDDLCATENLASFYTNHEMKEGLKLQEKLLVKKELLEEVNLCATEDLTSLYTNHLVKEGLVLQEKLVVKEEPSEDGDLSATENLPGNYTNYVVKERLGLQGALPIKEEPCKENDFCATKDQASLCNGHVVKDGLVLQAELLVKAEPREDERINEDLARLYADHEAKEGLVLGPECLQRPGAPLGSVDLANLNTCGQQLATTSAHGSTSKQWTLPSTSTTTSSRPIENNAKKKHTCKTCGREFDQYDKLMIHKLSHIGYNPYTCDICNKDFALLTHLETHKQFHTGQRPYACECGKAFTTPTNLKKHKVIHREKPYASNTCEIVQLDAERGDPLA
ncbi:zinc finger protein 18-like [Cydia strobilella]|uniref:zinc finger protein 18-like n=1 Tax=Cydia strobilella TaxID=1100964 RepID=UPI0030061FD1